MLRELDENDQDDANDLLPIENGSLKSHMEMDQMDRTRIFFKAQALTKILIFSIPITMSFTVILLFFFFKFKPFSPSEM